MLLSCFTSGDIYAETQLWKYWGELEFHINIMVPMKSVASEGVPACVSGSLAHTYSMIADLPGLHVPFSARRKNKAAFLKSLPSPLKQEHKEA